MRRFFRFPKAKFLKDWFIVLEGCLILAYLAWLFVPVFVTRLKFLNDLGMTSTTFGILGGSIATLSGALVAILIAAMFIITQYSTSSIANCKEVILKEGERLESGMKDNKLISANALRNVERLCESCKRITGIVPEEAEPEELDSITKSTLESLKSVIKREVNKVRKLEQKAIQAKDMPRGSKILVSIKGKLQRSKQAVTILEDLLQHMYLIYTYSTRLEASYMLTRIVSLLRTLTSTIGMILVATLILLVLSGLQFSGKELFSDNYRLHMAIVLTLTLTLSIIMIFQGMSINWKIINILIHGKPRD